MYIAEHDSKVFSSQNSNFEELYLHVRSVEKRMLCDEQVALLPEIELTYPYRHEWQIRKRSSQRLLNYLLRKNKPLNILEIGCGNGWLSAKLADMPGSNVIGLDINQEEVSQAKRVFNKPNLKFIAEYFKPVSFGKEMFDIVLFAASISYFEDLNNILSNVLNCLKSDGEIHIIDTHFYKKDELADAKSRCSDYYQEMGCLEMAGHYFHYSLDDMKHLNYKILVNPNSLFNKISKSEPFYWLSIKH